MVNQIQNHINRIAIIPNKSSYKNGILTRIRETLTFYFNYSTDKYAYVMPSGNMTFNDAVSDMESQLILYLNFFLQRKIKKIISNLQSLFQKIPTFCG